jgi:glycosyltransferase involved in cell wall biosynthesis
LRILVSHPNYPAQFRRLLPELVAQGHDVVFLAQHHEWHAPPVHGFRLVTMAPHRSAGGAALHPYLRRLETAVVLGQAAYRACCSLLEEGWEPEVVINHVGFGNGLYLRDAFPKARRIGLFEWYYNAFGSDVDFLQQGGLEPDRQLRIRTWNAQVLLELADCDVCVTPTHWQRQQFPAFLRSKLQVIHEGIDTRYLATLRQAGQGLSRPACLPADPDLEVVTYVSRCFEEYRGFPQAMQALALLQQRRPNLHVLIVGHDGIAYGAPRADGRSWGEWAREEVSLDPGRTHWLGVLQDEAYHQVLANSTVHFYLTVPFVLSWSFLEAMAAGCAVVASATPPVEEVLCHGVNGLLVDFFDSAAQANALESLLNDPASREALARGAQQTAGSFAADLGVRAWIQLLQSPMYADTNKTAPLVAGTVLSLQ